MATRSTIAIERADGTVAQVYCHWDGYLDHNGKLLLNHWSNFEKLEQLIALGDLSALGENIDDCVFYGRDRGETGVLASTFANFEDYYTNATQEEFDYILRCDGFWDVNQPYKSKKFTMLSDELYEQREICAA